MARSLPLILVTLLIIIALISGVLIWGYFQPPASQASKPPVEQKDWIVVAKTDLPWGVTLNDSMVTRMTKEELTTQKVVLPDMLPDDRISKIEELQGRVLAVNLQSLTPILESHLAPRGVRGGVDSILAPEKRAMAVKVDQEVAVAGFIKPGHNVDVLVTMKPPGKHSQMVTKTVIENARVLAAGTQMQMQGEDGKAQPVSIMTLEVNPQEAEKLTLASTQGRLRLVLRSSLNPDEVLTKGETARSVLDSYREKTARKRGPQTKKHTVEVLKGSSSSTMKFYSTADKYRRGK